MQNQGGAKKKNKKKLQRLTGKSGGAVWSTLKLESRFLHRCSFDPVELWRFVYIFFYSFSPFPPLKERQEQSDKLGRKLFYFILNWDCCFRSKWCWQETHQEQSWLVLFSEVLAGLLKCRSPETNFTSSSGLDVFCALDVKSRLFISWMGVWVQALRWEQTSGSRGITCYWVKSVLFFFFGLQTGKTFTLKWCLYRCIFGVKCVWVTTGSVGVLQTVRNNFAFICTAFFHMMNAPRCLTLKCDQAEWIFDMFHDRPHILLFQTSATSFWAAAVAPCSSELSLHGRRFCSNGNEHTACGVLD